MTKKEMESRIETLTNQRDELNAAIKAHIQQVDNLMQHSGTISGKDLGVTLSRAITELEMVLSTVGDLDNHLVDLHDA